VKQITIIPGVVLQWWLTTIERRIRFRLLETEEQTGTRWLALGFAEGRGDMHQADIVVCRIDDRGNVNLEDMWSPRNAMFPVLDVAGDGTSDVVQWDSRQCDFVRDFDTGDDNDRVLNPGSTQKLIFARGQGPFNYHGGERYKTTVILSPLPRAILPVPTSLPPLVQVNLFAPDFLDMFMIKIGCVLPSFCPICRVCVAC
jgi:hypothetical protein